MPSSIVSASVVTEPQDVTAQSGARATYGKLHLNFEAILGQTDSVVKILTRGNGAGMDLTSTEVALNLWNADFNKQGEKQAASSLTSANSHSATLRM